VISQAIKNVQLLYKFRDMNIGTSYNDPYRIGP
jgi:hypothetical protein